MVLSIEMPIKLNSTYLLKVKAVYGSDNLQLSRTTGQNALDV